MTGRRGRAGDEPVAGDDDVAPAPKPAGRGKKPASARDDESARRRRRAELLAELAEARELRARVAPRRTRLEKTREALRHRLFRLDSPPRRQV